MTQPARDRPSRVPALWRRLAPFVAGASGSPGAAAARPPSKWRALANHLLRLGTALVISVVIGSAMLLWAGANPIQVYGLLLHESFLSPRSAMIAIQRATPLVLTSAAATMAFQAGAINMGLVAQFSVGASAAAIAGRVLPPLPTLIVVPLILLISGCAGAAAGFVPAIVKRISGITEVVTGMITNSIVINGFSMLVGLVPGLRRTSRGGIQPNARLANLHDILPFDIRPRSEANTGIFVAIAIVLLLAIWMSRSRRGYEIRMTRYNPSVAEWAGIHAGRMFFFGMMLSGAIAAMAGAVEVMGVWGSSASGMLNVGEKDLIIALAGGQTFVGSLLAALAYGALESGALSVVFYSPVPRPFVDMLVELMVIFAALPSMFTFVRGARSTDDEHLGGRFIGERF